VGSRSRLPCCLSLVFLFYVASFRSLAIARSLSLSLLLSFSPEDVKRGAMRKALGTTTAWQSLIHERWIRGAGCAIYVALAGNRTQAHWQNNLPQGDARKKLHALGFFPKLCELSRMCLDSLFLRERDSQQWADKGAVPHDRARAGTAALFALWTQASSCSWSSALAPTKFLSRRQPASTSLQSKQALLPGSWATSQKRSVKWRHWKALHKEQTGVPSVMITKRGIDWAGIAIPRERQTLGVWTWSNIKSWQHRPSRAHVHGSVGGNH
jgi:hypothetical protein